jgi:tRNA threonylcarbamoyladenosine biosynthesis protein TsaB
MNPPSDAKLLLIETSGRIGQIGLAEGAGLRAQRRLDAARRHARDLAPAVKDMLAALGWRPSDIAAVVVSRGPGSYTGLRVGIMSAKTFAYATGCRVVAIDTFATLALQAGPGGEVEVIADAQQQRVYAQRFHWPSHTEPRPMTPLAIYTIADWLAQLPPGCRVTGPVLGMHTQRLAAVNPCMEDSKWEPGLDSLLRLALPRLAAGECDDLWKLEPLYARPSSAEEVWQQAGRP